MPPRYMQLLCGQTGEAMTTTQRWLVLCVVLMGTFMAILDVAIVNVAVPSIRSDLHASFGEVEFVVSAYTLTYAGFLVTGGRLGDNYGRRFLFILGLVVFAAASAACGLAPTTEVLIIARAVQGVGGALMYPQVLAIIQVNFEGADRAKRSASSVRSSVSRRCPARFSADRSSRSTCGTSNGGRSFSSTCRSRRRRSRPQSSSCPRTSIPRSSGLDWGGVGLLTTALLLLIVPLLEGRELGWPLWIAACFVAAFPLFGLFIWYERRVTARGGRALVRMELFACKSFAFGVPIAALFQASYAGYLFTLALYLQVGLGFSALQSGMTSRRPRSASSSPSLAAPRLIPLLGRQVLTVGYVMAAFGLAATATTVYAAGGRLHGFELAPSLFIVGLGNGFGLSPLVGTVISGLAPQEAGSGAGIVTTTLQVGNALGVALIGLLFFTLLGAETPPAAYADAFALTLPGLRGAAARRRRPRQSSAAHSPSRSATRWSSGCRDGAPDSPTPCSS